MPKGVISGRPPVSKQGRGFSPPGIKGGDGAGPSGARPNSSRPPGGGSKGGPGPGGGPNMNSKPRAFSCYLCGTSHFRQRYLCGTSHFRQRYLCGTSHFRQRYLVDPLKVMANALLPGQCTAPLISFPPSIIKVTTYYPSPTQLHAAFSFISPNVRRSGSWWRRPSCPERGAPCPLLPQS